MTGTTGLWRTRQPGVWTSYSRRPNAILKRAVWRITLPDGKTLHIIIDVTTSTGLSTRLTDAMIQQKRERDGDKAPSRPA